MSWKNNALYFAWQSVRYARNRAHFHQIWSYYPRWRRALQPGASSMRDEQAWINFAALDYLDRWLKPGHRVFEYGGGGSTLFFCKRAGFVATVEHDAGWFDALQAAVREKGYRHWEGFPEPGDPFPDARPRRIDNPSDYYSNTASVQHLSFERYAKTIHRYPEAHFDLVLVDGRARPACIQESLAHLKPGGLLVIDNTERDYYLSPFRERFSRDFTGILHDFSPTPYVPGFTRTTILEKRT